MSPPVSLRGGVSDSNGEEARGCGGCVTRGLGVYQQCRNHRTSAYHHDGCSHHDQHPDDTGTDYNDDSANDYKPANDNDPTHNHSCRRNR